MQDFSKYSYTIQLYELEKLATDVISAGHNVTVIINGEYYDVVDDSRQAKGEIENEI